MRSAIGSDMQHSLEIKMPNTANRSTLKALMDLLSDAHADITARAITVNNHLLAADNPTKGKDEQDKRKFSEFELKWAGRGLDDLLQLLDAQQNRVQRVYEEIEQIKKNLKVI